VSCLRLDHVGYAVASISDYLAEFFEPLFGPVDVSPVVEDPAQRVRVAFVTLAGGDRIELIEPTEESSPVWGFLRDRRGGLYHVCYAVESLEDEVERFKARRCMVFSGPTPATAFGGRRIVFLYTPQRDIIELVEAELAA